MQESMKSIVLLSLIVIVVSGCTAGVRNREGLTWEEWQRGIRTRAEKVQWDARQEAQRNAARESAAQQDADKRQRYLDTHPNLSPAVASGIVEHTLARGMNGEQVILLLGNPGHVNKSIGVWGTTEQWVYMCYYLYLRNGILDSWQTRQPSY
jgi:hypothetical protein